MNEMPILSDRVTSASRPLRLGFLGTGWIGRHRMKAMLDTGLVEVSAMADTSAEAIRAAREAAPGADVSPSFDALLDRDLDGVVIATPSAMHAEQAIRAFDRGLAVFCQKPLGRNAAEVADVVAASRRANRLLGVDLSYRFTSGMQEIRSLIRGGRLGSVYAADMVFHNAYGPDKDWFYDKALSGGGCVIDLGVHLVDLALWALDFPAVTEVSSRLFRGGSPLAPEDMGVEDYAVATIGLASGAVIRLACSWRLHAGREAVIGARFFGTDGGAEMHNLGGSFYDFAAEQFTGTTSAVIAEGAEEWGGRAAADWARRLADGCGYDSASQQQVRVAEVLDRIYGR